MLNEEHDILIERFFRGELSATEMQAFKDLLSSDAGFRAEVELQRNIVAGISTYGKGLLKTELQQIHNEVKGDLKNYNPPNNGSWLGTTVKTLLWAAVIGGAAYFYVNRDKYKDITHQLKETVVKMDSAIAPANSAQYRRDTVWTVIKTTTVKRGDTVEVYSEEELREQLKGKHNVTIKRDTVIQTAPQ